MAGIPTNAQAIVQRCKPVSRLLAKEGAELGCVIGAATAMRSAQLGEEPRAPGSGEW